MDNKWIDIGTGHFRILLSKDGEEHYMQIVSENAVSDSGDAINGNDAGNSSSPIDLNQV